MRRRFYRALVASSALGALLACAAGASSCNGALGIGDFEEGVCDPEERRCSGNTPQLCDAGRWRTIEPCDPGTCSGGECVGECAAGAVRCADEHPQACGADGRWSSEAPCKDGQHCQAGECVVACSAGSVRCEGAAPQVCDANGEWQDGAPCSEDQSCSLGACVGGPSCSTLGKTCGPAKNEGCCQSPLVIGGAYHRSNEEGAPATISDFRLDRFEITVGRFRTFVDKYPETKPAAGAGAHPRIAGSGWDLAWSAALPADRAALVAALKCDLTYETWTDAPANKEALPMNCLNWYVAFAFCAWDGGRLPTEAEWNYAAAGGNEQRPYPWSSSSTKTIDSTYAVYDCTGDNSAPANCAPSDILDVGSRSPDGDGRWGHADLAGSMWEWTLDGYTKPYESPCADCANLKVSSPRVIRGGSFGFKAAVLLTSNRFQHDPAQGSSDIGARCARDP